eukprot:SAG31_NODE_360_length_17025_cov_5.362460_20_plen_185_part_00
MALAEPTPTISDASRALALRRRLKASLREAADLQLELEEILRRQPQPQPPAELEGQQRGQQRGQQHDTTGQGGLSAFVAAAARLYGERRRWASQTKCEDCNRERPTFGLPAEGKKRWCAAIVSTKCWFAQRDVMSLRGRCRGCAKDHAGDGATCLVARQMCEGCGLRQPVFGPAVSRQVPFKMM